MLWCLILEWILLITSSKIISIQVIKIIIPLNGKHFQYRLQNIRLSIFITIQINQLNKLIWPKGLCHQERYTQFIIQ